MPEVEEIGSDAQAEIRDEPTFGVTPAQGPPGRLALGDDEGDDDDFDETLGERLLGLTEMFPEPVRKVTGSVIGYSWKSSQFVYTKGRSLLWVLASSAAMLALPVMFETERVQMEEQQMQQQRQILLGPNAAVSGSAGLGSMPQIVPPGSR